MARTATPVEGRTCCARCGHTWSFHQKQAKAQCKAMGCAVTTPSGKPVGRCPGFVKPKAVKAA